MPSILNSLKLLADPTRLRLVLLLAEEALSVAELQEILGMGQSRISTQLAQLKKAGLVSDQRSGKNNIYSAQPDKELLEISRKAGAELSERKKDLASLHHVLRKRKDRTRAYFDELAGKFGRHYVPGRSWKALAEGLLKILNFNVVADLGAGEGTLSQLLAQRAQHVIAIDHSKKMVAFGKKLARENDLPNLEYRLGDIESPPIDDKSVDLAFLSQALHHAANPARALREVHRILKPRGRLVILDLLQHSFDKARELYADTHLGFAEVEIADLLEDAGFKNVETVIVDREEAPPHFQTLLAVAEK
ncbi:MAG: metalloregulator ArsR/SmtB family transcription factor [Roseibacillus sp.]|nr:metalloregulator ArsR/SmtB family transcription factor [Roseibacillus sp.]